MNTQIIHIGDAVTATKFVKRVMLHYRSVGLFLEVGTCFNTFCEQSKKQPEKPVLAPAFHPLTSQLNAANGFWVIGRNHLGEIAHTHAARMVELDGQSLADFMETQFSYFGPGGCVLDANATQFGNSPGTYTINGRVAYQGEFWLKGGKNSFRGTGSTEILSKFLLALVLLRLSPDFVFSFMTNRSVSSGLAAVAGYIHQEPGNFMRILGDKPIELRSWTMWMRREEVAYVLKLPILRLDEAEAQRAIVTMQQKIA